MKEARCFEEKLAEAGIATTRIYALHRAVQKLHSAVCHMDSHNRKMFDERYGGHTGIYKLMYDYSESLPDRDIFPPDEDGNIRN